MLVITKTESVETGFLAREPEAERGYCFVYQNSRGKCKLVEGGNRLSQIELKADKYKKRYTVRKGNYNYKHLAEYASQDIGKFFQITLLMNISIADPVAVVQNGIHDVNEYIDANIGYGIEMLTKEFKIEDFYELKQKLRSIAHHTSIVDELQQKGFSVSKIEATVSLSNEDMAFYRKQEEIKREAKLEELKVIELEKIKELERQNRLKEEERQKEIARITKEEKQKENARLAKLQKEGGVTRLVLEREEENKENVDILLEQEEEDREHQRKRELELEEHQRKMEEQRMAHELKMREREMDLMQKMIEMQMKNGDADPAVIRTIIESFSRNSNEQVQLASKPAEKQISWGAGSIEVVDEKSKDEDWD